MFFKNKKDYQQQIQWQYPERPVLKAWTIKARNYDLRVMGIFFAVGVIIFLAICGLLYYMGIQGKYVTKLQVLIYVSIGFIVVFPFLYANTYGRRRTCVYRFTSQGIEFCTWNDMEKWKTIVLVVGILMVVVIIIAASVYPGALMALFVGPPIMGWFYYSMFMRSDHWEMEQNLVKKAIDWNNPDIEGLTIFRSRRIIAIQIKRGSQLMIELMAVDFPIFCPKDQYEDLIVFFKQQLSHVPHKEGKISIIGS